MSTMSISAVTELLRPSALVRRVDIVQQTAATTRVAQMGLNAHVFKQI